VVFGIASKNSGEDYHTFNIVLEKNYQ